MYYSRKVTTEDSRANVDLGRMSEFVHTLLSKIDNPLTFKFTKRKSSQLKRVRRLNALKDLDAGDDDWEIKDIAGKKQAVIYGRAIYSYYADSQDGYKPHLDNVDVYDFLIDPAAGGLDIEKAMYIGDYGVVMSRSDLKAGIKSGRFLKEETKVLLDGSGNSTDTSQEETNKKNRTQDQNVTSTQKEIGNVDKFKFWRWGTTYDGVRYYLLLSETGAQAVRIDELADVFVSELWWYWTWAAFIDLTEFWSPSYCDYVREIFMAQGVSINQTLDNSEQINKPQKVVNVGALENLAELKYRKDGYIKVKKDFDVDKAVQTIKVPAIDTPLKVFQALEAIQEKASGVTAGSKGVSDDEKVAIYKGNEANTADRYGLLNKSYSFGYKRFAKLWKWGVKEHLTKKVAVDILGPDGVDMEEVSKRDIFRKGEDFNTKIEASDAETALSEVKKGQKVAFLQAQDKALQPVHNLKKSYEIQASIVGFTQEEIRELQDTSDFADAELMSEAERDIERILDGEIFKPNQAATNAYKARMVQYMYDHEEDIDMEQFTLLSNYILKLEPIIIRNTNSMLTTMKTKFASAMPSPDGTVDPTATDTTIPTKTDLPLPKGAPVLKA